GARSAVERGGRAAAGLSGDELRAGALVRGRARLPRAARPLVRRARQRSLSPHAALPPARSAGCGADAAAAPAGAAARPPPPPLPGPNRPRPFPRRRQQRLPAPPALGRPPRRAARLAARSPRGRARARRARLPAPTLVRPPSHDHRARARPRAAPAARRAGRARSRDAAARALRPTDPGVTKQAELAHLFRTLKAPAAARALPKP